MSLRDSHKDVQHELGKATKEARELGRRLREEPEKASELQGPFDKALDDVKDLKQKLENIKSEMELEDMQTVSGEVQSRALPEPEKQTPTISNELHHVAFDTYLRSGARAARRVLHEAGIGPQVINALIEGDDTLGGFTAPDDWKAEVIKASAGFTVVRQAGARVVPTSRNAIVFPTINRGTDPYSSDLTTGDDNWKGEAYVTGGTAPTPQDKPTFGQERVPVHTWAPDPIEISRELLDDTAVPLDSVVATLIGEVKGLDEDNAFLFGDGVGKPEGIAVSGATTVDLGPSATAIQYAGVINLWTGLPAQYRNQGTFIFNSDTLGALMQLESTAGANIFPPNAPPGTILQRPYLCSEFMPDFSDSGTTVCMIFGDFRHYIIAERKDLMLIRLVERYAPNMAILPIARVGGQVAMNDGFRLGIGNA